LSRVAELQRGRGGKLLISTSHSSNIADSGRIFEGPLRIRNNPWVYNVIESLSDWLWGGGHIT